MRCGNKRQHTPGNGLSAISRIAGRVLHDYHFSLPRFRAPVRSSELKRELGVSWSSSSYCHGTDDDSSSGPQRRDQGVGPIREASNPYGSARASAWHACTNCLFLLGRRGVDEVDRSGRNCSVPPVDRHVPCPECYSFTSRSPVVDGEADARGHDRIQGQQSAIGSRHSVRSSCASTPGEAVKNSRTP